MRWIVVTLLLVGCGEDSSMGEGPVGSASSATAAAAEPPSAERPPQAWVEVDASSVANQLRGHSSRYLLVNVWSTWCEPCVEEMPQVVQTARAYESRGLGLVLITTDPPAQRDAAHDFLVAQGAPMPSWIKVGSDDAFIRALHEDWSGALPATFLMNESREVVHRWEEPVTAAQLRGPIEALLGGRG